MGVGWGQVPHVDRDSVIRSQSHPPTHIISNMIVVIIVLSFSDALAFVLR